jgi:hypothetical protein
MSANLEKYLIGRGKVREIYDLGSDGLLLVASDRISAFDVIMPNPIPDKGRVLTGMTLFWLDRTRGIQFARRFWADLRDSSTDAVLAEAAAARPRAARRPRGVRPPDLRTFPAIRPLRHWLAERLLGSLEVELGRAASCAAHLDSDDGARTLRIPAVRSFGAEAKAT